MNESSACIVFTDAAIKRGDRTIWQHGNFTIPTGSVTAIVGTNGTGKTTMMKAELGLLPLSHGSLTVLSKPAGEMNKRIGYVPQSYVSDVDSNLTAEQSVLLGLTGTRFGIHPVTKAQKAKAHGSHELHRHRRQGPLPSVRAVRRPASACRHRPGAGMRPAAAHA